MKKLIQSLGFFLFIALFSVNLSAGNITLQINHTVGDEVIELTDGVYEQDNTAQAFNITRCQYYISEIQLVHDGGQTIDLTDLYLLVNANQTDYDLGEHEEVVNLEAINFNIGVPEEINHGDPALWPSDHPLGLANQNMHWGWTSGYRFIALEGETNPGTNLETTFQFHAVADKYYTAISLETIGVINEEGNAAIVLESDIQKLIKDVTLQGNIEHGEGPSNAILIGNFAFNNVFEFKTVSNSTDTGIDDLPYNQNVQVYPNPAKAIVNIDYDFSNALQTNNDYSFIVTDLNGKIVYQQNQLNATGNIVLNNELTNGVYLYQFFNDVALLTRNRLVILE